MKYKVVEIKEDGTRVIEEVNSKKEAVELVKKYNSIGQYSYKVVASEQ